MSRQPPLRPRKRATLRALMQADEETRVILARQWWQENWLSLLGGLVIGAGLVIGIYKWQMHQEARYEMASNIYFELLDQEKPAEDLSEIDQYDDTSYPALIRFWYARLSIDNDGPEKAIDYLKWVMENYPDKAIAELARIRWLRVLLMQKQYQEVLDNVGLFDYDTYAESIFEEIHGDALAGLGRLKEALKAYRSALELGGQSGNDEFLKLKINDLSSRI